MNFAFARSSPFASVSLITPLVVITASIVMLTLSLPDARGVAHDEDFMPALAGISALINVGFFALAGSVFGAALSIVSLARKEARRVLAVLGFGSNGIIALVCFFILFGVG